MNPASSLALSGRHLRGHGLRTALTTLGVVVGVAAVVVFLSLGAGLEASIVETVTGDNPTGMYLFVRPEGVTGPRLLGQGGTTAFTDHDVTRLRDLDGVRAVYPYASAGRASLEHGGEHVDRVAVDATDPGYFSAQDRRFVAGGPFEAGDDQVVLNVPAAEAFEDPVRIGDRVTLDRGGEPVSFTVAGVVEPPPTLTARFAGGSTPPAAYVAIDAVDGPTAVSPATGERERVYPWLVVDAEDPATVESVRGRVDGYLKAESDASALLPEGHAVVVATNDDVRAQADDITATFDRYLLAIGAIALLVGAIGITNVMLVSVAERTRELGILRAIGAQRRDVLQLLLVETLVVGCVGSLGGALAGVGGAVLATRLLELPFRFEPAWLVAAVAVGLAVAVAGGLYPAWRAARVDPIAALRWE